METEDTEPKFWSNLRVSNWGKLVLWFNSELNELLKWILLHQRGFIIGFGGVNVLSLLGPMLQKDWLVYRENAWSAIELRTWWV